MISRGTAAFLMALVPALALGIGCGGASPADVHAGDERTDRPVALPEVGYPDANPADDGAGAIDLDAAQQQDAADEPGPELPDLSPDDPGQDATPPDAVEPPDATEPEVAADAADVPQPTDAPDAADAPDTANGCPPGAADCKCEVNADCDPAYTGFCGKNLCNKAVGLCLLSPVQKDGTACDDADPCTIGDRCTAGACGGSPNPCGDSNPCTLDSCAAPDGCLHVPKPGPCDDGDECTGPDGCEDGACKGGPALSCDDGNDCTADSCAPASGCVHSDLAGGECDDRDQCTVGDHCENGKCTPDAAKDCDDGNDCTADSCDPASGCFATPIEGACDDKDPCTVGDHCEAGECKSGATGTCVVCHDGYCVEPEETCETCPADCGECPPDCVPVPEIGCGGTFQGTTADGTAAIDSYGGLFDPCFSPFSVEGPERVIPFRTDESVHVRVTVDASPSHDVFVLGTNCAPLSCSALGIGFLGPAETVFDPVPGQTAYLTVDGTQGGPFTLSASCMEAACGDGADNDADGATDCDDADCGGKALACGATLTGRADAFSHAGSYSPACAGAKGDENDAVFAFSVASEQDVWVVVTPEYVQDRLDVYVLSGGCTGAHCVARATGGGATTTVQLHATPGTYRVVVEEEYESADSTGRFDIRVDCSP